MPKQIHMFDQLSCSLESTAGFAVSVRITEWSNAPCWRDLWRSPTLASCSEQGQPERVDCWEPHQLIVKAVDLQPPQAAIVYYDNLDIVHWYLVPMRHQIWLRTSARSMLTWRGRWRPGRISQGIWATNIFRWLNKPTGVQTWSQSLTRCERVLETGAMVGLSDPTSTGLPHVLLHLPDSVCGAPMSSVFRFAKQASVNPAWLWLLQDNQIPSIKK